MSYLSYFVLKFKTGLQYRFAAVAGISTQLFFGLVYISVYVAFYESNPNSIPMPLEQLVTYVWLGQAFFSLTYMWDKDNEIIDLIKNGNVAYELIRPQDLYFIWFSKIYGKKLSTVLLRFSPVIIFALLLPSPLNITLNFNLIRIILFLVSLFFSSLLVTVINLLFHIIVLFTLDEKGVVNIFMVIADILSGLVIPLVFFPDFMQKILRYIPFSYVSDFSYRLYVGNFSINYGIIGLFIQFFWIIFIFILGKLLMKKALKKAVIQGG